MTEPIHLGPDEAVDDRPFTQAANTIGDAANLERMRQALTQALRGLSPEACACEHTLEFVEHDGRAMRLIIVRPRALLDAPDLFVVGFCGQRRAALGERELEEMAAVDAELVAQLCEHPHMLCYCSIQCNDGDWHNLVLMANGAAVPGWREGARHQWAVESLTPRYYRSIRLHNGTLPRGLASERIVLTRTKYYDFGADGPWRAVRQLEPAMIKPARLRPGDTLAAVSLSWGGPGTFPHRYQAGKRQLEQALGVRVVETPHALRDAAWLQRNPRARADDLMAAFADPSIAGIVSTIGGDDSIRILPHLDLDVIRAHPKVMMGFSDTTVSHFACFKAGLVSFYGPSIMAGFAENGGPFPYMLDSVRRTLCSSRPVGRVAPNADGWTVEFVDWADPANQSRRRALTPSTGWRLLQGRGVARGRLIGGCIEVLDWLRGTAFWPPPDAWRGAILFLETSEEAPSPEAVTRMLRAMAATGALRELTGLLVGRPGGPVPPERFGEYDQAVLRVIAEEQGMADLPIISGMDFGHTDPMFVLPIGVQAEIDAGARAFSVVEAAVADVCG